MPTSQQVTFQNAQGQELAGRLELPEQGEPRAFALFAHCFTCSKDSLAATRISRALGRRGFAVLRFDFTGLGGSDGEFANTSFSSNVQDLVHAAGYLREHHAAPALLVGHSLGGAAVLSAARELPEVRAVATIGAPSDPSHVEHLFTCELDRIERDGEAEVRLAGRPFRIQRQFVEDLRGQRMGESLRALDAALMIFHSPTDEVVSIDHARELYVAARHPKSFVSLDGADHLLTRRADAEFVADVLAAWAPRHLPEVAREEEAAAGVEPPSGVDEGVVRVESSGGRFGQRVLAGRHELRADEPRGVGGDGTGPSPYDLLTAALGACTSMTLQMYAARKEWPLESVRVDLRHSKIHASDCETCAEDTPPDARVDRIDRELEVRGDLDEEQRARLVEIADRCPVHRTLTEGIVDVRTKLVGGAG